MADPVTLAGVGMAASAGGGILGAFGAESSASSSAAMYNYKAGLALMNQNINKQNASWATQSGGINAMEAGLKAGQELGLTKAVAGASGFDVNSGSATTVRKDQVAATEFDQNVIRFDAAKTAYGYEAKAAGDEAEANLDFMAASNAKKAGDINAFSSILGSASSVASKWTQGNMSGIFSGSDSGSGGGLGK